MLEIQGKNPIVTPVDIPWPGFDAHLLVLGLSFLEVPLTSLLSHLAPPLQSVSCCFPRLLPPLTCPQDSVLTVDFSASLPRPLLALDAAPSRLE